MTHLPVVALLSADQALARLLGLRLSSFCSLVSTSTSKDLEAFLNAESPELLILDLPRQGSLDLEALSVCKKLNLPLVLLAEARQSGEALVAAKMGAKSFLVKPLDLEVFEETMASLLEQDRQERELHYHRSKGALPSGPFTAVSPAMAQLSEDASGLAQAGASPVLIQGETGSGKEVLAQHVHSQGKPGPFIAVNMAALPHDLVESELFGHEKGAFTGAQEAKKGLIELAQDGTLFLDEIGSMPLALQAKLLRFLESHSFRRVGGLKDKPSRARIIAATNVDLKEASDSGDFRADLYYRLQVAVLRLPPLRERPDDIRPLAERFLQEFSSRYGKSGLSIHKESWKNLNAYRWPGNVRELRNLLERCVMLARESLLRPDQLLEGWSGPQTPDEGEILPLEEVERRYVAKALEAFGGNLTKAAKALGISRVTLRKKLKGPS